jgi:cell division protein FtsA
MAKKIAIGLDIGASAVRVMVAEVQKSGELPKVLGVGEAPSQGIRKGCVVDAEEVAKSVALAVKDAEHAAGVPITHAYISLGGTNISAVRSKGAVIVSRADNEIADHDIKRAVDACYNSLAGSLNKTVVHTHPIAFTIDQDIVTQSPAGLFGTRLEAETLLTTGINQHLRSLVKSVEAAGIAVDDIVAAPHAAAIAVLNKKQKEAGVALIDFGSDTTSLVVFEEGAPISLEVLPVGSAHVTNDIAIGFQLSISEAEEIKYSFAVEKNKTKLKEIVEARLYDIFELVDKHLKKIGRQRLLPSGVVLTGGGANLLGIADFARKELQLPAEIGKPVNIRHNYEKLNDPRWSVVAGLCIYGLENSEHDPSAGGMGRARSVISRWLKSFLP